MEVERRNGGKEKTMDKTKIDWCDMSWNPITGCKHGCEYCYARRMAERFGGYDDDKGGITTRNPLRRAELHEPLTVTRKGKTANAPYQFGFEPTFHYYRLDEPARKTRPRNIFVGSMADIFGKWVPAKWIAEVLDACEKAPQHNYLFLTKNPKRYIELDSIALLPRAENFWYGSTVTGPDMPLFYSEHHKTFLSIEPLLNRMGDTPTSLRGIDWVIIGAMTGPGSEKHRPERAWVEEIVEQCRRKNIPVFMKSNLAPVWGDDLLREFPPELEKGQKGG